MRLTLLLAVAVGLACLVATSLALPGNAVLGGYDATDVNMTASGISAVLTARTGADSPYGDLISPLALDVVFLSDSTLRIRITDPGAGRWEVPFVAADLPKTAKTAKAAKAAGRATRAATTIGDGSELYKVDMEYTPFGLAVTRVSTGQVIFNTTVPVAAPAGFNSLIYSDQYLEWTTELVGGTDPALYGLGERVAPFRLAADSKTYVMFSRDVGTPPDTNLYGVHPFYMQVLADGSSHGVFLLNSNAQEVFVQPGALTWRTIGGVLDFFVMLGPEPETLVQQYHAVIGIPAPIPYWVLGFAQSKWGYHTIEETEAVWANYSAFNIPLDTMFNDIDYMDAYLDFTTDPVRYPSEKMSAFVAALHAGGQHYVCIIDPGIHNSSGYAPYEQGLADGVFITNANSSDPAIGVVWPGTTAFPDFLSAGGRAYWADQIKSFRDLVPVDGLWIDMNEIVSFTNATTPSEAVGYDRPPYVPGGTPLWIRTLSMNAETKETVEYNAHSLYGFSETIATHEALINQTGERSFVLARSTFAGQGHYGAHWLGDNTATWDDLYYSIPGMMNFNMFGIPLAGADICGFNGNTTEELCTRWLELGAFYPWARDHSSIGTIPQEAYAFGTAVADIARDVLLVRYSLHPYYYTLFMAVATNGGTVVRSMLFEFPTDTATWSVDKQFMVGSALLVTPVLTPGAAAVTGYFPQATWYDFYTGSMLGDGTAATHTLPAPIDVINVHVRGGSIVPMQAPEMTTTATRENPVELLVAMAPGGANGSLWLDDGLALDFASTHSEVSFAATTAPGQTTKLVSAVLASGYASPLSVSKITVYGAANTTAVSVNGDATEAFSWEDGVLVVFGLDLPVLQPFAVVWT